MSQTSLALFTRQGGLREGVRKQPNAQEQEEKGAERKDPTWLGFAKRSRASVDQKHNATTHANTYLDEAGHGKDNVCIQ